MCKSRFFWGRRGTMIIGALVTMAFFFAYTQVKTNAQNLGFNCAIGFCLNIYYGTLYAYTPEGKDLPSVPMCCATTCRRLLIVFAVLPSAHRGTGNGISIGLNRIMGIVSAGVASGANTATAVPIYICAA